MHSLHADLSRTSANWARTATRRRTCAPTRAPSCTRPRDNPAMCPRRPWSAARTTSCAFEPRTAAQWAPAPGIRQPARPVRASLAEMRHRAVRAPASLGRNLRHEQSVRQTPVVQFRNLSETHRLKLPGLKPFKTRRLTHKGESHRLCRWTRKGSAVPSCRSRRPTGVRGPLACDDGHTRQALL